MLVAEFHGWLRLYNPHRDTNGLGKFSGSTFCPSIELLLGRLIGMCLSFQGQLEEICPHSVSDLRAL